MLETRTEFEVSYDGYTAAFARTMDPADAKEIQDAFAPLVPAVRTLEMARAEVKADGHLTAEGKRAQLDALSTTKGAAVTEHLQAVERRAQAVADEIARIESQSAPPRVIEADGKRFHDLEHRSERTVFDELREREIRDRIMAMPAGAAESLYLDAIKSNDLELIRAIELAPQGFPLVSAASLAAARTLRLESSPAATRLKQLRALRDGYGMLLDAARRSLGER